MVASVGVRLVADGVDLARRGFATFGDAGRKAMDEVEKAAKGTGVAARATGQALDQARGAVSGFASEAGPAGELLSSFGPAGIAAAAAIGAFAIGMAKARESMDFADDLVAAAAKIGITVESLQELQFAAGDADVEIGSLRGGLEGLNGVLGAVQRGAAPVKVLNAFKELGISREQLASMRDASELIPLLADGFAKLDDRTKEVSLARNLKIEDLLPLLRGGSEAVKELREEAHELGVVMSDDVANGLADASRELEIAEHRIDVGMKTAFAGLSDETVFLSDKLADLLVWFNKVLEAADRFAKVGRERTQANPYLVAGREAAGRNMPFGLGALGRWAFDLSAGDLIDRDSRRRGLGPAQPRGQSTFEVVRPSRSDSSDDGDGETPRRTGGGGAAAAAARAKADAERAAAQAEREAEQRAQRLARAEEAQRREEQAAQPLLFDPTGDDLEAQTSLAYQKLRNAADDLARELKAEVEAFQASGGLRGLTQDEADLRLATRAVADDLQRARIDRDRERQLEDRALALRRDELAAVAETLGLQGDLAATQRERRAVALKILDAERAVARQALELTLKRTPGLTEADRTLARSGLEASFARRERAAREATRGPGEQFADELRDAARAGSEAFETLAVDGLRTLEDGIVGAIGRTRELGEVFRDVAGQIVADLTRIGVQRTITEPLARALFGGRDKGGGGLGSLLGDVDDLLASSSYAPGHRPGLPKTDFPFGFNVGGGGWLQTGFSVLRAVFGRGFDRGGYTGDAPRTAVTGVVHGQEFVSHAAATAANRPLLEAINRDPLGVARVLNDDGPFGENRRRMQAVVGHLPGAPASWRHEQAWQRQLGGVVNPGGLYTMAEDGRPEVYLATRPGQVLSNDQSVAALREAVGAGAAAPAVEQHFHINNDLRGALVDKDVEARLREAESRAVARAAQNTPGIAVAAVTDTNTRNWRKRG